MALKSVALPVDGLVAPRTPAKTLANAMRRRILAGSLEANVGHIGSSLSITDIIAVLFGGVLNSLTTNDADRDRFVLCKGHAALAMYVAMFERGLIDETSLRSYCRDGSPYGAHPELGVPGVDISTGSLGQGLSVACGLAYGQRLRGDRGRVFALLSDAECNEGQVWEAAQFAGHHQLDNLVAIVDLNGMQAMGRTQDVLDPGDMARRWASFGWAAVDVDGHDVDELTAALNGPAHGSPRVIVARTVLGKGVSFMEDRLEWHYRNLSADLARDALSEVEAA